MISLLGCIAFEHNPWFVLLAVLICVVGSWITIRLYLRASSEALLPQRLGWQFLTAVCASAAIWCTHFVAMLGFRPRVPVDFDPVMTIASLLIALIGSLAAFNLAGYRRLCKAPLFAGMVLGLTITAMHYTGMAAYEVRGIAFWNATYVVVSGICAVVFSAAALHVSGLDGTRAKTGSTALLVLAIASLHFIGMTAFKVEPLQNAVTAGDFAHFSALALAVSCMAFVIVGTGVVSYMIEDRTRNDSVERLRQMALSDVLTGLPNRARLIDFLHVEVAQLKQGRDRLALVAIDLNRFKEINDSKGHQAGDEVLRIIASRITKVLRPGEFVARVGGDEFVGVRRYTDPDQLTDFLARIESATSRPVQYDDWEVTPGASIGVAMYPDNAQNLDALQNNADLAMYRSKADPHHAICFYEPVMDELVRARRALVAALRDAVTNRQLQIYYQVQTSLLTGEIVGYEALLRWQHPERGFIPPSEFIPLAEENGLINTIGEWVLFEACKHAATWDPPYRVAVNLSAAQLSSGDLPRIVVDALRESGLSPDRLELELTESIIFADRERALQTLGEIKALGVSIALDDFGTGYSSLGTLQSFSFDRIKLDRSFVCELARSDQAKAIIRAVLALGKSLSVPVLAEGIETHDQLLPLIEERCDEVQGFLFGKPVPLAQIVASGQIRMREPFSSTVD
ncbi:bifunctional diguanylate cyclase/phosphodiesterase [Burkholderia sp. Ac-20365]|uniref:putative bifunctional diguanylate cyclase/phosphodiesterase n=1 Tax=Burkholderia sp. Ac-20365 TaxID=2703897 RepID=UPI00197C8177|nr:bifunctional diguanylate cyclase/phosphodiesterase [Burkholderia sp. Ac-20365]MBN3759403.1 EAL domain-containing protein [Burkholderia sp. Ac-20365]